MNGPKVTHLEKILSALKKSNRKYLSIEDLSKTVGLYPDVLGEDLSFFDPLVMLDPSSNVRSLEKPIAEYLAKIADEKQVKPTPKRVVASSKEIGEYPTVASFVYQKMTSAGGLVDSGCELSDHDLHVLQKIVNREVLKRKKRNRKTK